MKCAKGVHFYATFCALSINRFGDPVQIVTQTVLELWETFGGEVNSKGFKVINPCVKSVYGDSITQRRLKDIYQILVDNGFACNNVSLASGSFSMQCIEEEPNREALDALEALETTLLGYEEDGYVDVIRAALEAPVLKPFTRDSFGKAVKATYCEVNGKPVMIFKDPKTDDGKF